MLRRDLFKCTLLPVGVCYNASTQVRITFFFFFFFFLGGGGGGGDDDDDDDTGFLLL